MNRFYLMLATAGFVLMLAGCESDTGDPLSNQHGVLRSQCSEKDFIKNQYFWLTDTDSSGQSGDSPEYRKPVPNCRENYRLYSHCLHVALPAEHRITRAEFWIMPLNSDSGTPGRAPGLQRITYWTWPWEDYEDWFGKEKGLWQKLRPDSDYTMDSYLGVVRLKRPLLESDAFACAFATANDTFGTFAELADTLSLVLLKAKYPEPDYNTWNLMFRHVYPLGIPIADITKLKLTISRVTGGAMETRPPGMEMSYTTYFRFDLEQPDGTAGPDGIMDNYSSLISREYGELHFLDLTPFEPSGYDDPPGTLHLWDFSLLEQTSGDVEGFRTPHLYTESASQLGSYAAKWQVMAEFQLED